jgi:hypothetical protein
LRLREIGGWSAVFDDQPVDAVLELRGNLGDDGVRQAA